MSKKQGRLLMGALIGLFALLAGAAIAFLILWLNASAELRQSAAGQTDTAVLQAELDTLQSEHDALAAELEETKAALETAQTELQTAKDETARVQDALEEAQAALEEQSARPVYTLDVGELAAGTVVSAGEVDPENLDQYFQSYEIEVGDAVYNRIYGKSYVDNPNIGLGDLRYFKVLHYNFDHEIQVGELIANAALEQDYLEIFRELFESEYEIYSMYLIDDFWTGDGDSSDTASIEVNNTSAFCYRQITGGGRLSNHAYGRAIDINPQQNPYVSYSSGYPQWSHSNANDYIDRTTGYAHVITYDDLCYQVFTAHGFSWGGDWSNPKDYQHFEKKG